VDEEHAKQMMSPPACDRRMSMKSHAISSMLHVVVFNNYLFFIRTKFTFQNFFLTFEFQNGVSCAINVLIMVECCFITDTALTITLLAAMTSVTSRHGYRVCLTVIVTRLMAAIDDSEVSRCTQRCSTG
jgi:hypothetical protein